MDLRNTEILVLTPGSVGGMTARFREPLGSRVSQAVSIISNLDGRDLGLAGFPELPAEVVINGTPGGSVRVRVDSVMKTGVQFTILENKLSGREVARVSFLSGS